MAKLRMLYSSNAFWAASGYGVQGKALLPRLAELSEFDGRDNIAQFAWFGLQGGIHNVEGFQVYPAGMDAYGNDVIGPYSKHFGANLVVTLIDAWVLRDTAKSVYPALWCPWLPIDHDPVPRQVLEGIRGAHLPLTYSKWGHQLLTDQGVENVYIPHGIEPSVFYVIEDRQAIEGFKRQILGPGADHLTIMVAANKGNPDRKAFQVQLRAWADFVKDKPGARLYIHTEPTQMYGGLDLIRFAKQLGLEGRLRFPDRITYHLGYPPDYLAMLYNAADVFMGAAMAEGFGIPIIEAQACGCPVIVTDFSSMPELVRWGFKVPPRDMFYTPMEAWQAWPDWVGVRDALQALYEEWVADGGDWNLGQREKVSAQIHEEYNWSTIVENEWKPLAARLALEAPSLSAIKDHNQAAKAPNVAAVQMPQQCMVQATGQLQSVGITRVEAQT